MDEHVLAAGVRLNETIAVGRVEHFSVPLATSLSFENNRDIRAVKWQRASKTRRANRRALSDDSLSEIDADGDVAAR